MPFVKNEIYEVILELSHNIKKLKDSIDTAKMKKDLLNKRARATKHTLSFIEPRYISTELKGETKEEIITELVDILASGGKLLDRNQVLADVLEREQIMSTGMEFGAALPHCKTDAVAETVVALGIKKTGVDFDSIDGLPSRIFILIISPKKISNMYVQFLAAVGAILADQAMREAIINAATPDDIVNLLLSENRERSKALDL